MLSDDKIAEIRDSVDLVALISEYVPLRRQGARFVGLCPFHTEKSPSFGVSRGKNFYYCFGCHETGDAIKFLQHVEGLNFPQALEKLAERSGIEIPRTSDPGQAAQARAREQRERLAEVMAVAMAFYEAQLRAHPHGTIAQAELEKRGVTPEIAQRFHLGYAPAAWDALAQHLTQVRVDLRDASEVGLIAPRRQGGGYYDRFRHRLMFPVADQHGRIIAFSGRALAPAPGEPRPGEGEPPPAKYINSPESPLYKKGQALFGIHAARVAMRKANQALLCEGNFDLLQIHQAGFEQVVAPLGTAFTLEQAKLLRRFVEEVVVVFDGDNAGRKATHVAFELLESAGLKGRAVRLPGGHDPDTFMRSEGPDAFRALVAQAPALIEFLIDDAAEQAGDAKSRGEAIQGLGPVLARIESPVERELYVERVGRKFDVRDLRLVKAELRRGVLVARGQEAQRLSRRGNAGAEAGLVSKPAPTVVRQRTDLPNRQCEVVGAVLDCPSLLEEPLAERLDGLLTDVDLRAIFRSLVRVYEQRRGVDAPTLLEELASNPARAWLSKRLSETTPLPKDRAKDLIANAIPYLEKKRTEIEAAALKKQIEAALRSGDSERARELTRQRDELLKSGAARAEG